MTIREIAIGLGFTVDAASKMKAEKAITGIKNFATKALSAIGIGFSALKLNELIEEWNDVNKQLKVATSELEDQQKVQDEVLESANECRVAYKDMAKSVATLLQSENSFFKISKDAAQFLSIANQAFKVSGATTSQISTLNNAITNAFTAGRVSAGNFNTVMSASPNIVKYLAENLKMTERQVKALGLSGNITAKQLYSALTANAENISTAYKNTNLTISETLVVIRNEFGTWLSQFNEAIGLTNALSKTLLRVFNSFMSVLKKVTSSIERFTNRLGGIKNLLKLIGIVGGSLLAVIKSKEIIAFLKSVMVLISAISVKTIAIVGIVILLALVVEDLINFLQGNESVVKGFFESIGLNAEEVRTQMLEDVNRVKNALSNLWQTLKGTLSEIWNALKPVLKQLIELLMNVVSQILPVLCDLIETLANIISEVISAVLLPLIEFISTILSYVIDFINDILPVLLDLIESLVPLIKQIVDAILPALVSIIKAILPIIQEIVSKILPVIAELIKKIIPLIVQIVEKILPILCDLIEEIVPVLVEIINKILPIITKLLERLLPIIMQIVNKVLPFIVKILDALMPILQTIIDAILPILTNLLNIISPILEAICDLLDPIFDLISAILGPILSILDILQPIISTLLSLINTILKPIISIIQTLSDLLTGVFGTAIKTVTDLLQPLFDLLSWIMDLFSDLFGWVSDGLGNITDQVGNWVGNLGNGLSSAWEGVKNVASTVGNGIAESAKTVWSGVKSVGKKIGSWFGLAEGGYIGANNPTPVVIGDNKSEGEIVSPISKMRATVIDALRAFNTTGYASEKAGAVSTITNQSVNRSVTQNVHYYNTFEGSRDIQKTTSRAMKQSAGDTTRELANALAYAR